MEQMEQFYKGFYKGVVYGGVVYGTSSFCNPAEAVLTSVAAKTLKRRGIFFVYPKGDIWNEQVELFSPEEPPTWEEIDELHNYLNLEILTVDQLIDSDIKMKELAEEIRKERKRKSFLALTIDGCHKVYVSSKDKLWNTFRNWKVKKVLNNPLLKIGGAFLYKLTSDFCQKNNFIFLIPRREKSDVIKSVKAQTLKTGRIDIITTQQYHEYQQGRFKVVPPALLLRKLITEKGLEKIISEKVIKLKRDQIIVI